MVGRGHQVSGNMRGTHICICGESINRGDEVNADGFKRFQRISHLSLEIAVVAPITGSFN